MPTVVVIDRTGTIKEVDAKKWDEDALYKQAGFRSATDFQLHHVFVYNQYHIHLYGKTTGKAGQENKYDFPPPVDNTLFFGSCLLVNRANTDPDAEPAPVVSLSRSEWDKIYEAFFGGFEDIGSSDDEEEEIPEEELRILADPKTQLTKQGYVKDDFIVDDGDDDDDYLENGDDVDTEESDESEVIPVKKAPRKLPTRRSESKAKAVTKAKAPPRRTKKEPVAATIVSDEPSAQMELVDELSEEEYFE